jgi:hypothetical protein
MSSGGPLRHNPQVGNIGTAFTFTVRDQDEAIMDVSAALTKTMRVARPAGATPVTWTLAFVTNGTDGKVRYVTASANDLPVAGTYQAQVVMTFASAAWKSNLVTFTVEGNLP